MTTISPSKKGKTLRILFVIGLSFNFLWIVFSAQTALFDEQLFLHSNSLRELSYLYYRDSAPEGFVGMALYELYKAETLTISPETLAFLDIELEEPRLLRGGRIDVQLVTDAAKLAQDPPPGTIETYSINSTEVGFLLPEGGETGWQNVVGVREGERVLFLPVSPRER